MKFTSIGYRTIAYAAFGYIWYVAMSSLSSIITILAIYLDHTSGLDDYISMALQGTLSTIVIGLIQILLVYLIFRYNKTRAGEDYSGSIAYLFAGSTLGISFLLNCVQIPAGIIQIIVSYSNIYNSRQLFFSVGQMTSVIIQLIVAFILIKKSEMLISKEV